MARNRFAILELTKKLRDRGRFRQSRIFQNQLCLWAHEAQNAASSTQLRSVPRKKRGGFVGSGPPKPPFAPMRGVGEGEKIYIFIKPLATTPLLFTGYRIFLAQCVLLMQEKCQSVSFMQILSKGT